MLELINITKSFDDNLILNDISFQVSPGQIFGLVGPNGAGKTTTLRIILNIIRPDSGEVLYNEITRSKVNRSLFGYLPEERGLYQRARVLDMLVYFGVLNRLSRHRAEVEAIRLLDKFGLVDYTKRRVHELSKGMQQKIQLVAATLHDPEVVIMDEPFSGLDPVNQMVLRDTLKQFKEEEKIIILSSHNMAEVEQLSDYICLINQGKVVRQGPLEEIKKDYSDESYYIESANDLSFLRDIKIIDILEEHNRSCKFSLAGSASENNKIIKDIFSNIEIRKFYRTEPTLNDIFIDLVQKEKPKKKS
jgi:ABC-2 type transport system ATP-binding protein